MAGASIKIAPLFVAAILLVAVAMAALSSVVRYGDASADAAEIRESRVTAYRLSLAYTDLLQATHAFNASPSSGPSDLRMAAQMFSNKIEVLKSRVYPDLQSTPETESAATRLRNARRKLDDIITGRREIDAEALLSELESLKPAMVTVAEAVHDANEAHYAELAAELRRSGFYFFLIAAAFMGTASLMTFNAWLRNRKLRRKTLELQASEKKLRQISFYRQQFLANMSHEFRTPLNAIQGFSEAIICQRDTISRAQIMDYIDIVLKSARDLTSLTEDVLDLSKIDAGKLEIYPEDVDFTRLLDDCLVQFEAVAAQRGIRFQRNVESRWLISCDRLAIKRCITNVLSNAIKFSDTGGSITVNAYLRDRRIMVLEIADQGCGIPEGDLQSIWMVYARSSMSRKNNREGAGLGLAMVKGLMESHHGFVEIQSREGVGTAVRLCFPASMIVATGSLAVERAREAAQKSGTGAAPRQSDDVAI